MICLTTVVGTLRYHPRQLYCGITIVPLLVALCGCGPAVPETIDSANLVGRWELTRNGETEWFDLSADGALTATIDRNGFIATTLSQGPHLTASGTWQLTGRTLTIRLTHSSSSESTLTERAHIYEILNLTDRNMETVSANGDKKTLLRAL